MNDNAPVRLVVRFCVPVRNFLFVYSGQSVRVVVVRVRIELAQKPGNVFVKFRVLRFPPERHNDMLIDKRGVRNNPGFFVCALVKRNRQRPYLFFDRLFEL